MQQIKNINQGKAIQDIYTKYLRVCSDAATKEKVFVSFKSNPNYRTVLEHCSPQLGERHFDQILINNPGLFDIENIFSNDKLGRPILSEYGALKCSPSTLQYINVVSNLMLKFKSLEGFSIVEIGGGYGGQCKVIQDIFSVKSYDLIDLAPVCALQIKYLTELKCIDKVRVFNAEDYLPLLKPKYDLVISNYALSEMPREVQLEYVKNVCLRSTHGYLTCNDKIEGVELIEKKYKVTRENDIEGERKTNFILSW